MTQRAAPPNQSAGTIRARVPLGIGITGQIEPHGRPPLAISRPGQQVVYQLLIGVGTRVVRKGLNFLRRRRQPQQIERNAANQRRPLGRLRRKQTVALEPRKYEMIDRVARPYRVAHCRQRLRHRFHVSPMPCIGGARRDPLT